MKSRKLWGAVVGIAVILLVTFGIVDEANADKLEAAILAVLAVFGLYTVGNVGEHFAKKGKPDLAKEERAAILAALQRVEKEVEKEKQDTGDLARDALWKGARKLIPFL
jgi:hypothetical protein